MSNVKKIDETSKWTMELMTDENKFHYELRLISILKTSPTCMSTY